MKTYYLYSSPSGPIGLIEGEKMPLKPEGPENLCHVTCGQWLCKCNLYIDQCNEYEAALQRAKESAISVSDQEMAKDIIAKLRIDLGAEATVWTSLYGKEGAIYGPFTGGYHIRDQAGLGQYLTSLALSTPSASCPTTMKVAILSEPEEKESQDAVFSVMEIARMESIPAADRYEMINQHFTITRK